MPIRFFCPGCNQPIEVDDEFAQRLVACPYCNATVNAPAASAAQFSPAAPAAAAPAGSAPVAGAPITDAPTSTDARGVHPAGLQPVWMAKNGRPAGGAKLATLGLLCGLLAWIGPMMVMFVIVRDQQLAPKIQAMQKDPKNTQEAMQKVLQENIDAWTKKHALLAGASGVSIVALTLVGLVSSIVALLRSTSRKGRALIGLGLCGICGSCMLLQVIGVLVGGAAAAGGGS